jgi:RHS repeat-associated protein
MFTPDPANGANPPLTYYMHTDHLDTPRVVVDKSNNLRWRWLAEPFGTTAPENNPSGLGAFTQNLRFPGQYADQESGLFYNWNRSLDPTISRYTTFDPIGLAGGINGYSYVDSSPVDSDDPNGLQRRGGGNPRYTITIPSTSEQRGTWSYGQFYPSLGSAHFRPVRIQTGGENTCGQCFEVYYVAPPIGSSRSTHREHANERFYQYLTGRGAPTEVGGIPSQQVIQHMTGGRTNALINPPGFEWHHPHNNPNALWLIRRCDHYNPMLQPYLHPGGVGGYGNFYGTP